MVPECLVAADYPTQGRRLSWTGGLLKASWVYTPQSPIQVSSSTISSTTKQQWKLHFTAILKNLQNFQFNKITAKYKRNVRGTYLKQDEIFTDEKQTNGHSSWHNWWYKPWWNCNNRYIYI